MRGVIKYCFLFALTLSCSAQGYLFSDLAFLSSKTNGSSGGGGGFNPASISGVVFGYIGDNYTSGSWPDSSGHGYTATRSQYTPVLGSTLNGHATVAFTNTVEGSGVTNNDAGTLGLSLPFSTYAIVNITNAGTANSYIWSQGTDGTGASMSYQGGNNRFVAWKSPQTLAFTATNTWILLRGYWYADNKAKIQYNGTASTSAGSTASTIDGIGLGIPAQGSIKVTIMSMAEIWGYNAILGTTDETNLVYYLTNKYGISW